MILTIITDVAISGMVRNLESVDIDKRTDQPCFEFRAHPPHEKESNQPRWASINVKNVTPFIIKRCFLTVEDLRQNGKSVLTVKRQRRLLWSSGDGVAERDKEIDITPGEEKVGDVAVSLIKENLFKLETWSGLEIKPKGIYEINISIRGRLSDSPTITTSIFDLEYEGGNIITITEKGQEKWQEKNPTPKKNEKIRKVKYPHVSTNSTT